MWKLFQALVMIKDLFCKALQACNMCATYLFAGIEEYAHTQNAHTHALRSLVLREKKKTYVNWTTTNSYYHRYMQLLSQIYIFFFIYTRKHSKQLTHTKCCFCFFAFMYKLFIIFGSNNFSSVCFLQCSVTTTRIHSWNVKTVLKSHMQQYYVISFGLSEGRRDSGWGAKKVNKVDDHKKSDKEGKEQKGKGSPSYALSGYFQYCALSLQHTLFMTWVWYICIYTCMYIIYAINLFQVRNWCYEISFLMV